MLNRAGRKVTRLAEAEAAVFHGGKPLEQSHYKVHAKEVTSGAEYMAFFAVDAAVKAHATPSYDSFWTNQTFCREVCLFLVSNTPSPYLGGDSRPHALPPIELGGA